MNLVEDRRGSFAIPSLATYVYSSSIVVKFQMGSKERINSNEIIGLIYMWILMLIQNFHKQLEYQYLINHRIDR